VNLVRYLTLTLIAGVFFFNCTAQKTQREGVFKSDVVYLKRKLFQYHPNIHYKLEQKKIDQGLRSIKSVGSQSPIYFALDLQKFLAKIGDAHTYVELNSVLDSNKLLPLTLYWFDDGVFILETDSSHRSFLGKRIKSINGIEINTVTDSLKKLVTHDNEAIVKDRTLKYIKYIQVLEYFKFVSSLDTQIAIECINENGMIEKSFFELVDSKTKMLGIISSKTPLYKEEIENIRQLKAIFWDKYLPDSNIYYIQYNKCTSREIEYSLGNESLAITLPSFQIFLERIMQTVNNNFVDKLIIDFRFNNGGYAFQGDSLVNKIKSSYINRRGKLYIIVGRRTFSSAISNVIKFKEQTNAIIVGEETSGKPYYFGSTITFELPMSKIQIRCATQINTPNTDDRYDTVTPDVSPQYNFIDYITGVDPYLNAISAYRAR
jgi:hypothetical protein